MCCFLLKELDNRILFSKYFKVYSHRFQKRVAHHPVADFFFFIIKNAIISSKSVILHRESSLVESIQVN